MRTNEQGGSRWGEGEVEVLRRLADRGVTARRIAHMLDRTPRSVIVKAWKLGIRIGVTQESTRVSTGEVPR